MVQSYVCRRKAVFKALTGKYVTVKQGAELIAQNGVLLFRDRPLCLEKSQNAHDYFCSNDDKQGTKRGNLINRITSTLERRDEQRDQRWAKVWEDKICQKYKRPEHEDYWLWNHEFYGAPILDLMHIAGLVGA